MPKAKSLKKRKQRGGGGFIEVSRKLAAREEAYPSRPPARPIERGPAKAQHRAGRKLR